MTFKIYTKTGDTGKTALYGGMRVDKNDLRVEAYGTLDELNANIAALRDRLDDKQMRVMLLTIQNELFSMGSHIASLGTSNTNLPQLNEEITENLEVEIDRYENELEPLKNFILPGGHPIVSTAHIVRTVCRRAERRVMSISQHYDLSPLIIQFLNRLSDYFFVVARKLAKDTSTQEIIWRV